MTKRNKFILTGIIIALAFFPVWRFLLQGPYLKLLGFVVAKLGDIFPYGDSALSTRIIPEPGEIAFDLFEKRQTIVIEVSSIITNIVPLIALVFATPVSLKRRFIGGIIGIGIAFALHIIATVIILSWQVNADTGSLEGLKIFMDGVLIAAFPLLYWSVWADSVHEGGIRRIFIKR